MGLTARGAALRAEAVTIPAEICAATGMSPVELAALVTQLRELTAELADPTTSAAHD